MSLTYNKPDYHGQDCTPASPNHRIEYIDGLRALAVLSVLVSHIVSHSPNLQSGPAYRLGMEGPHGVDLFFVLSGFCLAFPTLQKYRRGLADGFGIGDFAVKRLVRIVPPFFLATFAFVSLAIADRASGHGASIPLPPPGDLLKSLLFLDGRVQLINGSFWTLMVEFRWYFLFPVSLVVWLRSPRAFCAIGVGCAVLYALTRARGLDLGTLPGFMTGIVAADVFVGARMRPDVARFIKRYALLLLVPCVAAGIAVESNATIPGFNGADVAWPYQPTIIGWQLAMFFFVVAAGEAAWLRRALSLRALVATGIASYAIYLVHEPIVGAIVNRLHGPVAYVAAAAVALAAGFAFWYVAERPFTTGSLRRPLLDGIRPAVRRCFAWTGVPDRVALPQYVQWQDPAPAPRPADRLPDLRFLPENA
jgi:peptidoglycan/LPS O-acetylase OafA/YrhL